MSCAEDYTVEIDLPPYKRGDQWPGIHSIGPVLVDDATPTGSLSRIRMMFRKRGSGNTVFTLDSQGSPDADITITDAATWEAQIPEPTSFLPSHGPWDWDMEFYETGKSMPMTYYKGVLNVLADITT